MTERCQTKFTEKFDNQNYIIYVGILTASVAVLYFYRFHFVAVIISYVLGCLVCYYGLKSNVLNNYLEQLTCHFDRDAIEDQQPKDVPVLGCVTCGSKDCARHDPGVPVEPWVGLQVHKQLDQAIEDFYNTILDQFINSWYSKVTMQPFFIDELRHQLRYASACLLRRAVKINYSRFITERLVPCALDHYCVCSGSGGAGVVPPARLAIHPAAANRTAELHYLRSVANALMPYLLNTTETQNDVFRVLIREIFSGWVLLSLTDVLADPYILNALIILATGDETMAQLPTTPNYEVEFLETFARHTDSVYAQRGKLLRVDLEMVINDQDHFYSFMQYLKTTNHIQLLQFYKDIKVFQTKLLNPDLGPAEKQALHREACALHDLYLSRASLSRVPLPEALADELYQLLQAPDSIKGLQTSRALYQAARQSHAFLEKVLLPKFLHSDEYYNLLIGSRTPTGYQKQMNKKPQEKLILTALKLGNKLKGALKPQNEICTVNSTSDYHKICSIITKVLDGQVLDCFTNTEEMEDGADNMDILKYLDALSAEDSLREQDLSTYKVVLTNVETRLQAAPRRGTVRVFSLAVHRAGGGRSAGGGAPEARLWALERSENDFHLLRCKLHEFHGDRLLHDLPLPSRRDNSPMETLRYKYEDFLQRLLQKSLLQTSELLHLFLTVDGDFSVVVQASTLSANSNDIANIYQSVAHKLRKEKGQHLESFLRNLLVSSDMERFQALKQGTRDVEEAQEVSEDAEASSPRPRTRNTRNILGGAFGNNFDLEPTPDAHLTRWSGRRAPVAGFTQCVMFLLEKMQCGRSVVAAAVGAAVGGARAALDAATVAALDGALRRLLGPTRIAHLIRLAQGLIFGKRGSPPRTDPVKQREQARKQLLQSIPSSAAFILGAGLPTAVNNAFEIVQKPELNKQLVYNLLDLCLMELFPELSNSNGTTKEPKS